MDKPTQRALIIYETLLLEGSQTLHQLDTRFNNISRMGLHRALTHLRDQGWVRMRWGDNAWSITPKLIDLQAVGPRFSRLPADLDKVLPTLPAGLDLAVFHFADLGQFEVIEFRGATFQDTSVVNLVQDLPAQLALALSDPGMALRHLQQWLIHADPADRKQVTSGQFNTRLKRLRQTRAYWTHLDQCCTFAVQAHDGEVGVLQVACKRPKDQVILKAWVASALKVLPVIRANIP